MLTIFKYIQRNIFSICIEVNTTKQGKNMPKKLVGLRIPEEMLEQLEQIAKYHNQSMNQMAVTAITEWVHTLAYAQKLRSMILHKDLFAKLLEFIPDDKLEIFGKEAANRAAESMRDDLNIPLTPKTAETYMKLFPEYLSKGRLRWFEDVKIFKSEGKSILKGFHYLGVSFSKFFTYLSKELLESNFNYEFVEESIDFSPNSVYMEFIDKNK